MKTLGGDVVTDAQTGPAAMPDHRGLRHAPPDCSALGRPRIFPRTQFVFCVISQRARGLMIGVDACPARACNFRCVYCQVDRAPAGPHLQVPVEWMAQELRTVLDWAYTGRLREEAGWEQVPAEWLALKEVALAGDGEPTLCPNFSEVVETVVQVRAQGCHPFCKIVLATNGSALHLPEVQRGLTRFNSRDEIWIKLDAGTQDFMHRINRTKVKLTRIRDNILRVGRQRPVIIQSLFPQLHGVDPPEAEILAYLQLLRSLLADGAQIAQVQVYSTRKLSPLNGCAHLSLHALTQIARRVHEATGLPVDVF